jgi:hypothetical protein
LRLSALLLQQASHLHTLYCGSYPFYWLELCLPVRGFRNAYIGGPRCERKIAWLRHEQNTGVALKDLPKAATHRYILPKKEYIELHKRAYRAQQ